VFGRQAAYNLHTRTSDCITPTPYSVDVGPYMHFLDVGRGVAVRRWKGVGYGSSYINRLDILIGYA
jgi:hypothetical protein